MPADISGLLSSESDVDEFELVLPRSYEGWMRVSVPGYHDWKIRIRHNIHHSKTMQATEPLPKEQLSRRPIKTRGNF